MTDEKWNKLKHDAVELVEGLHTKRELEEFLKEKQTCNLDTNVTLGIRWFLIPDFS